MEWDSPKEIAAFLKDRGLAPKKRFGQNFLVSPGAREKILEALAPETGKLVWESGPGLGAMTHMLLERHVPVTAFEIDYGFSKVLKELFGGEPGFTLVEGDFLRTWQAEQERGGAPDRIVGNLPYASGSAMIASLIDGSCRAGRLVFTLQKEVARRMTAKPGDESYSSFSILCQTTWDITYVGDIKGGSFYPAPDIVSGIVSCAPHDRYRNVDTGILGTLVRDLFSSRRKTIRNNIVSGRLARSIPAETILAALAAEGISLSERGERLPVATLAAVAVRIGNSRLGSAG